MVSRAKFGANGWIVWVGRPGEEEFVDQGFRLGKLGRNIGRLFEDRESRLVNEPLVLETWLRSRIRKNADLKIKHHECAKV